MSNNSQREAPCRGYLDHPFNSSERRFTSRPLLLCDIRQSGGDHYDISRISNLDSTTSVMFSSLLQLRSTDYYRDLSFKFAEGFVLSFVMLQSQAGIPDELYLSDEMKSRIVSDVSSYIRQDIQGLFEANIESYKRKFAVAVERVAHEPEEKTSRDSSDEDTDF